MACMENECRVCGHVWFDNGRSDGCEKCGDDDPLTFFDEDPQHFLDHSDEDAEEEIQWAT